MWYKRTPQMYLLCIMLVIFAVCVFDNSIAQRESGQTIIGLSWLEGTWSGDGIEAIYSGPSGGVILSTIKMFKDGKVVFFEYEHFTQKGENVFLTPYPGGTKSTASFVLTGYDLKVRKAVFVNDTHDWPKRISYEIDLDGSLLTKAYGVDDSTGEYREFVLKFTNRVR